MAVPIWAHARSELIFVTYWLGIDTGATVRLESRAIGQRGGQEQDGSHRLQDGP